jgi:hypothetical protein
LGGQVAGERSSAEIFRALAKRWEIYLLRKAYGSAVEDKQIVEQWEAVLEPQRILLVPDEQRAVDLALGIIARSWDRFDDFQENMAARQPVAKVKELANSLDARSKRRRSRGA